MKKRALIVWIILVGGFIFSHAQSTTFSYTGAVQSYTVGPCVTSITVDVRGAEGATIVPPAGKGGRVQATIPVTGGAVLYVYVGGQGISYNAGGYNGGGNGANIGSYTCGKGGGASDIRQGGMALADRIFVGGGGGGCGAGGMPNNGGDGGGLLGNPGIGAWGDPGGGATQATGGVGGCFGANCGQNGALGIGGNGASVSNGGGGGGGGYYGGGGAGDAWGAGGGGSGYAASTATAVTHTTGFQLGNGLVIIDVATSSGTPPGTPAAITGPATVCDGGTFAYSISTVATATDYTWTAPAGAIISGQGAASVSITFGSVSGNISVTANNTCGTSAPATLAVTLAPPPSAPAAGSNSPLCSGTTLNLTASTVTGATYSWTGPNMFASTDQNPALANVPAAGTGTYSVSAILNGCPSQPGTVSVTVLQSPVVDLGPDSIICSDFTYVLSAGAYSSYTWQDNSTASTYTVSGSSLGIGTHTIYVDALDLNNCSGKDTVIVNVSACLGFEEISNLLIEISPNPADGLLNIHVNNIGNNELQFTIRNIAGQSVFVEKFLNSTGEFTGQLDISPLAKGIYFLEVNCGETFTVKKIVLN